MLWKKTMVMMAAFALTSLLAVLVVALPRGGGGPGLEIPAVKTEEITRIEFAGAKGGDYSLEKTGEGWRVLPIAQAADEKKIERLLKGVASVRIGNMVSRNADDSRYGVAQGGLTVAVYGSAGELWRLTIGKQSADKRGDYVRVPGDGRVFIALGRLKSTVDKKADNWRDRRLSHFEKDRAEALLLEGEEQSLSFLKEGDKWVFSPPPAGLPTDYRLDSAKVERVIQVLSNLNASEFEDGDLAPADLGLDPAALKLTVSLSEGEVVTVLVGKEKDKKYYARVEGRDQITLISSYQRDKLRRTPEDLRDLHVAPFDLDQAVRLEVRKGQSKLVFLKDDDQWRLGESSEDIPGDFRLDPNKVKALARGASRLEGKSLVGRKSPAGAVLDTNPKGVLSITLSGGEVKTITVGAKADDKEIYVRGDEDAVYRVAKFQENRLLKSLSDFKVMAATPRTPPLSPKTMQGLPPQIREQLLKQQREKIMQSQMLRQMMKKARGQKEKQP